MTRSIIKFSRDNIHYDLLKTGSVEVTSNKLLERGFLEAVSLIIQILQEIIVNSLIT